MKILLFGKIFHFGRNTKVGFDTIFAPFFEKDLDENNVPRRVESEMSPTYLRDESVRGTITNH